MYGHLILPYTHAKVIADTNTPHADNEITVCADAMEQSDSRVMGARHFLRMRVGSLNQLKVN
jgi:hypothetical protein